MYPAGEPSEPTDPLMLYDVRANDVRANDARCTSRNVETSKEPFQQPRSSVPILIHNQFTTSSAVGTLPTVRQMAPPGNIHYPLASLLPYQTVPLSASAGLPAQPNNLSTLVDDRRHNPVIPCHPSPCAQFGPPSWSMNWLAPFPGQPVSNQIPSVTTTAQFISEPTPVKGQSQSLLLPNGPVPLRPNFVPDPTLDPKGYALYLNRQRYYDRGGREKQQKKRKKMREKIKQKQIWATNLQKPHPESAILKAPPQATASLPAESAENEGRNTWICPRCTAENHSDQYHGFCAVCSSLSYKPIRAAAVVGHKETSLLLQTVADEGVAERVSDDEDDWSVDEYEPIDLMDSAFDEDDERRIRRNQERSFLLANGGGKKKRKTLVQLTTEKNNSWWEQKLIQDNRPSSVDEACGWGLLVFSPKNLDLTNGTYRRYCVMSNPEDREKFIARPYWIQRNTQQVCAMRRLDVSSHGSLGPRGTRSVASDFQKLYRLRNNTDHPYDPRNPMRPVVYNSSDIAGEITTLLRKTVRCNLGEIVRLSEVDTDRKLQVLNATITPMEGSQWWVYQGLSMPGPRSIMQRMSGELLESLAKIIDSATELFRRLLPSDVPFFPACEHRAVMLKRYGEAFRRKYGWIPTFHGVALIIGNGTHLHYDILNDFRLGYEWTVTLSAIEDVSKVWPKSSLDTLAGAGMESESLAAMLILYSRQIVGSRADFLRLGYDPGNPCLKEIVKDMLDESYLDVDLLKENDPVSTRNFLLDLLENKRETDYNLGDGHRCTAAGRKEGMTKMFNYSSSADFVFRFLFFLEFEMGIKVRVKDLVDCVVFVARESFGQWQPAVVFDEFCRGSYCGEDGGFKRAIETERNLFILAEEQMLYISIEKKKKEPHKYAATTGNNVWPVCEGSRHQCGKALLYQSKESIPEVDKFLTMIYDIIAQMQTDVDFENIAEKVYKQLVNSRTGMGHLSAMHLIHMAATTGLVPACYGSVAFVSENRDFGPGRFFDSWGLTKGRKIVDQFEDLCLALIKTGRYHIVRRTVENYACGKGRNRQKVKDYVYFYGTKVQAFFRFHVRLKNQIHELQVFVNSKWVPFRSIVTVPTLTDFGINKRLQFHMDSFPYGMDLENKEAN